jgi:hypothetical protein
MLFVFLIKKIIDQGGHTYRFNFASPHMLDISLLDQAH